MTEEALSPADRALACVRERASGGPLNRAVRVTLHFHPDRRNRHGRTVLESLRREGVYRTQFETGTSNGGLTAHPGGDRWNWESRLFCGAYDDAPSSARPVYGSLNFRHRRNGGSPRFGSAYFRLHEDVLDRATFCYPDSVFDPVDVGTADRAGVVQDAEAGQQDLLDDYVEAHVHGGVRLARDVEALVLDPCYRGTTIELVAHRLDCPIEWHAGFALRLEDVRARPDFRTPATVVLAEETARDGWLDARILGEIADGHDPQTVKHLWHYIARFGRASRAAGGGLAITLT